MILGKLLFGTLQAGTCRELAFGGVVVQHPAAGLQIIDIRSIQQLDATARQLQHHLPASAPLHPLDGAGQFGAELIIVHRLQHIIQCIYLVASDGILCHVGHKDQHHIRIHGPDGFGCSKAVQPWHLHVHKNDIESRRIVLCDLSTVCDETDLHLQALLLRILPDESVQAFPCFFLILYDRDPEHPALRCTTMCARIRVGATNRWWPAG